MKNKLFYISLIVLFLGCEKQNDWLSEKNEKSLVVPETLRDFQALLDDQSSINERFPTDGLIGTDNILLIDVDFLSSNENTRNLYSWNENIWSDGTSSTWNNQFVTIFRVNAVLEGLSKINKATVDKFQYDNILGQAHFIRAITYYNLSQLYCEQYDPVNATGMLGLPLRKTSDVNYLAKRSSLKDTYDFIIEDLKSALELLPIKGDYNRRGNRTATNALLSKVFLHMKNYEQALFFANESLALNSSLLDFNDNSYINTGSTYRFKTAGYDHPEILFYAHSSQYPVIGASVSTKGLIPDDLYNQYLEDDLRKSIYYIFTNGSAKYRGSYTGGFQIFCGIANNEVYLIKAECAARLDKPDIALEALNILLRTRFKTDKYTNYEIKQSDQLLELIIKERRKELPRVANIRWEDLRRLNKNNETKVTLKRVINTEEFILEPNSLRYVLPIPENEIQSSGLQQNLR